MLKQLAHQVSLPFIGEPLMGLQINGLLETRTIDFENVIIISANEGYLPMGKSFNSFIPYEIKREFGLPNYNDKDAIFAYHFYRLISKARRVFILYEENNETEKSRFINQLLFELPQYNPKITIETKTYSTTLTNTSTNNIEGINQIDKTPEILNLIYNKLKTGISASSLNAYRDCSLKFYYAEIAKIKEEDEIEEDLDQATFGTILHHCLENIFKPFTKQLLTKEVIEQIFNKSEEQLLRSFKEHFGNYNPISGKNAILYKVMLKLLENYKKKLIEDAKINSVQISIVEELLTYQTQINNNPVQLIGKADRIDLTGASYRIIDYKTGKVEQKDLTIKNFNDLASNKYNKAFQVLFYAYLFNKSNQPALPIQSGIISFRNLKAGVLTLSMQNEPYLTAAILEPFENYLFQLINEIINPEIPFLKTNDTDKCQHCIFNEMCNRI
jgi:hypothetical protein